MTCYAVETETTTAPSRVYNLAITYFGILFSLFMYLQQSNRHDCFIQNYANDTSHSSKLKYLSKGFQKYYKNLKSESQLVAYCTNLHASSGLLSGTNIYVSSMQKMFLQALPNCLCYSKQPFWQLSVPFDFVDALIRYVCRVGSVQILLQYRREKSKVSVKFNGEDSFEVFTVGKLFCYNGC